MKKAKKILLSISIGLLVFIVVAVIVVGLFLGKIVKAGVETVGPMITKTAIKLDAVDLSVLTGSANVKGLVVGNPEGYKTPNAISVRVAAVSVSPMSLLSDKIVVKSIKVEAPEITLEGNPLGANNLKKILDNVNTTAKGSDSLATNQTARAAGNKPSTKLEVDYFLITGAKVHFNGVTLPTLPDIELRDLGKGPEGITPADLTKAVLAKVTDETFKAVAEAAANIGKSAENLGKEGVNKITTGIGGLLKK